MRPFRFCPDCGLEQPVVQWPLNCPCTQKLYEPFSIGVGLLLYTADQHLALIERGTEPEINGWALPGGYLEPGETWQEGGVRETREETGIVLEAGRVELLTIQLIRRDLHFIFGAVQVCRSELAQFKATQEALALELLWPAEALRPGKICFSSHVEAVRVFMRHSNLRATLAKKCSSTR